MRSATSWREICAGVVFLGSITLAAPVARAAVRLLEALA
jgi:hypothetical protein